MKHYNFYDFIIFLVLLLLPADGNTATFYVTNHTDNIESNPGNGICEAFKGCSLRAAIMEANVHLGTDTIILPRSSHTLSIVNEGTIEITDDVNITSDGTGEVIIDGNGPIMQNRIFEIVNSSVNVNISDVTITNGVAINGNGGAILNFGTLILTNVNLNGNLSDGGNGGAISNRGELTLTNVIMNDNQANGGSGGAIYNRSSFLIEDSVLTDNTATNGGGAIANVFLSVVAQTPESLILRSMINANSSSTSGGAISNSAILTVIESSIFENTASNGGGISNYNPKGKLKIVRSSIYKNETGIGGTGGGLYQSNNGTTKIFNSTIAKNKANSTGGQISFGGFGGGIYVSDGKFHLTNVTVSENVADGYGGGIASSTGMSTNPNVKLVNTLLSDNTAGSHLNCYGPVTSLDNNLLNSLTSACQITLRANDLTNLPAMLAPFQTGVVPGKQFFPLYGNSSAIDAGNKSICGPNSINLNTDQNFQPRRGLSCEIGAIEY